MEEMFQEIQLRFKIVSDIKVSERTFSWRTMNFNRLWLKDIVFYKNNEFSFTTEFNAKYSREELENIIKEKTFFYTGEGISTTAVKVELVELNEEKDIYSEE